MSELYSWPIMQPEIVQQLEALIKAGQLAPALLFEGPEFSGRTTTAIELARRLNCSQEGRPDCECSQCHRVRLYMHPSVALFGTRYLINEISRASQILVEQPSERAYHYYQRSVERLMRHCDPHVLDGEALPNGRKIAENARQISERVAQQASHYRNPELFKKNTEDINAMARSLSALLPQQVGIAHIRKLIQWTHIGASAPYHTHKVILCENADNYSDAIHNVLLKTLEEVPPKVVIVLIVRRRAALPLTIRSRVVHYAFTKASTEREAMVLEQLGTGSVTTMEHYFASQGDDLLNIEQIVAFILKSASATGAIAIDSDIEKRIHALRPEMTKELFIQLSEQLMKRWRTERYSRVTQSMEELLAFLNLQYTHCRMLNINFLHQIVSIIEMLRRIHGGLLR